MVSYTASYISVAGVAANAALHHHIDAGHYVRLCNCTNRPSARGWQKPIKNFLWPQGNKFFRWVWLRE